MKIYTKVGDDGTTALYSGERVRKDDPVIELNGAIDEAQAALGVARSHINELDHNRDDINTLLVQCERDLWVVMSDVAQEDDKVSRAGAVSKEMVLSLETAIDQLFERFTPPSHFTVPGENRLSAVLDFARTVVRRAERLAVTNNRSAVVLAYLNRLSDLCWALARYCEDEHLENHRSGLFARPQN